MESALEFVIRVGDVRYTIEKAAEVRNALDEQLQKYQAVMAKLQPKEAEEDLDG